MGKNFFNRGAILPSLLLSCSRGEAATLETNCKLLSVVWVKGAVTIDFEPKPRFW